MEPHYNEDLGAMEITLLYQVSPYIRVKKQGNTKSWDQQNYLVITGFCYIRPLYNEVPLYNTKVQPVESDNTPQSKHEDDYTMDLKISIQNIFQINVTR